jgi:hypothetical protein
VAVVADAFGPIFLIPLQTRRFTIPGLTAGADVIACRLLVVLVYDRRAAHAAEGEVMKSLLIATFLGASLVPADTFSPDPDGFIRNWLVLAPIAVQEDSGASEIEKDFLGGEAAIKPKADEKVNVDGKILTWKAHQTSDFLIDFRQSFGAERGEDVAGYAVAYVVADDEMKVKLSIGSNDQCKVWLNGAPVIKFAETRTLDKDTDSADVTLAKGQNVLVFKVVNEKNSWQGAARFLKDGAPVRNVKISLALQ